MLSRGLALSRAERGYRGRVHAAYLSAVVGHPCRHGIVLQRAVRRLICPKGALIAYSAKEIHHEATFGATGRAVGPRKEGGG